MNPLTKELTLLINDFNSVRRYSNKSLLKDEFIAQHSANVGVISSYIYDNLSEEVRNSINLERVLAYSIFHDMDEIFQGDILNPVKYYHPDIKLRLDEYTEECLSKFKESSTFRFPTLFKYATLSGISKLEHQLLKLADIVSVYIKFEIESALGNTLLNADYSNIGNYLESIKGIELFNGCSKELTEILESIKVESFRVGKLHNSNILNRVIK